MPRIRKIYMPNFWAFLAQELGKIDLKSLKTADS
jgi:hypothetical protein